MARRTVLALLFLVLLLVPPTVSGQEKDPPWFENVAKERGLEGVRAKDCIFTDLDADGYLDLCLDRERLYLSEGGGKFALLEESGIDFPEVPIVPLKNGEPDMEKAAKKRYVPQYLYFADVDNDGDPDALWGVHSSWETLDPRTGRWRTVPECDPEVRSTVWLNDGKGRFVRGPESGYTARDAFGPAMALAIVDVDLDGNLDLYEGREYRQYGQLYGCGVDRLFKGDGKGGFTDVTKEAGLMTVPQPGGPNSSRPSYGVTHADVDNDGWPDLLQLAYGRQWNYLWRNVGGKTFKDVGMASGFSGDDITHGRYPQGVSRRPEQPFRSNGNTFDCAVGDIDNDGDLDLFLGEIQHAWAGEASDPPALLVNQGEEGGWKFVRKSVWDLLPKRMWTRDDRNWNLGDLHVAFADVDNDTRLDLLIGSGDYPDGQFLRLYHQQPDGTFVEVTDKAFRWEGCGDLSLGDYDRDGDVDILAGRSFMRLNKAHREKYMGGISVNEVGLFENRIADRSGNHWLNVRLVGKTANRSGVGARIEVAAGGVTQIREIRCGSGLANHQDALEASFGLGEAEKVESITVRWPHVKAKPQVVKNVPADRFVTITEGKRRPKLEKAR